MMTYRWIILAIAATMLGGAAWYFGRPEMPKEPPVETNPILASGGLPEAPKELPPKLIEVIDLASAYEPIREPLSPSGVDQASFFEDAKAPLRIPYAVDEAGNWPFLLGGGINTSNEISRIEFETERLSVMPRVAGPILAPMPREVK